MSEAFVSRAPGKLMLLGEYAVLDGAPAIVTAIDRFVEVRLRLDRTRASTTRIARGHGERIEFSRGHHSSVVPEWTFAVSAIDAGLRRCPRLRTRGIDLEIASGLDRGAPAGGKLGLGGSAAVTVAIIAALHAASGQVELANWRDAVFTDAFEAHRDAQNGAGSGADIAAAVYGGVSLLEPRREDLPRARRLHMPPTVELCSSWSGESAPTSPHVRRYLALDCDAHTKSADESPRRNFVRASRHSVAAFVEALQSDRLSTKSVNDNGVALEALATRTRLPLLTPALECSVHLARAAGAGAKISGAGGGDCAIALTDDAQIAERVRAMWRAASLEVLDLRPEAGGVDVGKA